jgi:hypothetical protein
MSEFLKYYSSLKVQLFEIVKKIKKEEKTRLLIDRR